ncbi:MAG: HEPN domain-containing protein [Sulfurimonas sp.]|nr:HEPN domain-containing protein [Sulfurimonas sp.]MDD5202176.1 HEPN domain-containing protein [Sulfurimonas sp.]
MQRAYNEFSEQIKSCNELYAIHDHLKNTLAYPQDLSDLLRAQIVYSVSALDKLIHDFVKIGMIEAFNNQRQKTNKFSNFGISLNTLIQIQKVSLITIPQSPEETAIYWFEQEIVLRHKTFSFQDPDKISDALSLIWSEEHKWRKIYLNLSQPIRTLTLTTEKDIKIYLKNIIMRRNQIVHEGDISLLLNKKDTIDEEEAKTMVDFIGALCKSIYDCVN